MVGTKHFYSGSSVGSYLSTAYLNLGAECELFALAVVYVDNFWLIKISLGDFRIHTKAYLNIVAECALFSSAVSYEDNFGKSIFLRAIFK